MVCIQDRITLPEFVIPDVFDPKNLSTAFPVRFAEADHSEPESIQFELTFCPSAMEFVVPLLTKLNLGDVRTTTRSNSPKDELTRY